MPPSLAGRHPTGGPSLRRLACGADLDRVVTEDRLLRPAGLLEQRPALRDQPVPARGAQPRVVRPLVPTRQTRDVDEVLVLAARPAQALARTTGRAAEGLGHTSKTRTNPHVHAGFCGRCPTVSETQCLGLGRPHRSRQPERGLAERAKLDLADSASRERLPSTKAA
jgi:hypothetical protein